VPSSFELFVARRYLRARRKEAVISVITVISVVGVAAGVMALVVALAINNGFRDTLQRNLLGAMAHINVQEKEPRNGIENWEALAARIRQVPHVTAAGPALYTPIFLSGPVQSKGGILKGVTSRGAADQRYAAPLEGRLGGRLRAAPDGGVPGIILGARLAEDIGMLLNSMVSVTSPQGELTPFGPRPSIRRFRVVGIFESGFYEIDDRWAYTSLPAAQQALSLQDVVNQIEVKLDDLNRAPEVARNDREDRRAEVRHHHLDGAQPATAERAQDGESGDGGHHRADRTGGRVEHTDHAGDDGDGKVPRHRGADVDGRAAGADPPHLHAAGCV
jgi:lipoprotein-releasing system permease protein